MTDPRLPESYADHDGGEFSPVNARVVATWPAPTFVESLAIDPAGTIFVSTTLITASTDTILRPG